MYPTGWGWITVIAAVSLIVAIYRRRRRPKEKTDSRDVAAIVVGFFVLAFLFSFIQWVSWYK
jgi:hypothetical protein